MKTGFTIFCFVLFSIPAFCQDSLQQTAIPDPLKKLLIVELSCGQCRLGLPGKSCDLAVRFRGKSYFVDGTAIDSHGDAHAKDGFCNAIRKAQVQGDIVDNRFKLTYLKLLPAVPKKVN